MKLVGDWIDRGIGDLAPLWPLDVLTAAVEVGARGGRQGDRARVRRGRRS